MRPDELVNVEGLVTGQVAFVGYLVFHNKHLEKKGPCLLSIYVHTSQQGRESEPGICRRS